MRRTREAFGADAVLAHSLDAQVVVAKADDGQVPTSGVRALADDERTAELARMMGGHAESETGLRHAAELLERARRSER